MTAAKRTVDSDNASSSEIEDMAAAWLARRYGGFSIEDSVAFEAWLAGDPRHADAVAELERAWRIVSFPATAGQGDVAREREHTRQNFRARRRRQATWATVGLATATLVVFAFLPSNRIHSNPSAGTGIVLRPDMRHLPDGSTVQLNVGAEIASAFTAEKRLVRLVRGEALFAIVKDASRPFVVSAGGVEVRAVGTAFTVRYDLKQVDVIVTEGTVAVERTITAAADTQPTGNPSMTVQPVQLTASQRTAFPLAPEILAPQVAFVTPVELATALAWRDRRIEFTRTPLAKAVELFNRENQIQLKVADADTGNFEISGIFWANDPDGFIRLLVSAFSVTEDRTGQMVILRKR
jgi:transmembrane sensor